jgi:hypothetical protein
LDAQGIEAVEVIPASRKLGRKEAADLARAASKVIVMKGKDVREFAPSGKAPKECVDAMLGPTGNLRAPTLRIGKTILVGFNEAIYFAALS